MIYQPQYVKDLLQKQVNGTASPSETDILLVALDIYTEEEIGEMLDQILPSVTMESNHRPAWAAPPVEELWDRLKGLKPSKAVKPRRHFWAAAAWYTGLAGVGLAFLWLVSRPPGLTYTCGSLPDDSEIPAGPAQCRLTLENGCTILIDSSYTGLVTKQGPVEVTKPEPGVLVYRYTSGGQKKRNGPPGYHTIASVKGGQYRIILPDGTAVRLNAASSIRFSLPFWDSSRRVELRGEAFFDVASHRQWPFTVQLAGAEIRVTGTRFNVKAYTPETVTTLLSGSLELKAGNDSLVLRPGEQAIAKSGSSIERRPADTAQVVSWKNVQRLYADIAMRDFVADMARGYNLKIRSLDCVPNRRISVRICYNTPPEKLFEMFRAMGLRFVTQGDTITFCSPPLGRGTALLKKE